MDNDKFKMLEGSRHDIDRVISNLKGRAPGRGVSIAITKLEEAHMWIGKELYAHQQEEVPLDVVATTRAKLEEEIERNKALVEEYKKIPPGQFAHRMIEQDIANAETALQTFDLALMREALEALLMNE